MAPGVDKDYPGGTGFVTARVWSKKPNDEVGFNDNIKVILKVAAHGINGTLRFLTLPLNCFNIP